MNIPDILNEKQYSLSFEIFPPKKDAPLEPIMATVKRLAEQKPSFVSVTYGAGGGANHNTVKVASFVQKECGVTALAHLTCLTSTREKIKEEVAALKANGIKNILALRGDLPSGVECPGDYAHAVDLIRDLKEIGGFSIGGACYPECHPDCSHLSVDIGYLKEKVDAGLDFMTTQMFFDNNIFYRYLYKLRERGISIPVIAGVMPVTNGQQITRICQISGTYLPSRFKTIVDKFGDNPSQMMDAGVAYATEQIIDLYANGIKAVHVYTMNKPEIAERIRANLANIIEEKKS
jgi:methylenetetrahydrofolate reductase (NADPH)